MFFALATENDYWKSRINLFVALAPVVTLSKTDSILLKWISKIDGFAYWLMMSVFDK
jgi:hypothetical protein